MEDMKVSAMRNVSSKAVSSRGSRPDQRRAPSSASTSSAKARAVATVAPAARLAPTRAVNRSENRRAAWGVAHSTSTLPAAAFSASSAAARSTRRCVLPVPTPPVTSRASVDSLVVSYAMGFRPPTSWLSDEGRKRHPSFRREGERGCRSRAKGGLSPKALAKPPFARGRARPDSGCATRPLQLRAGSRRRGFTERGAHSPRRSSRRSLARRQVLR